MDLSSGGYFNKEPGCSCNYYFRFSKHEASFIDSDFIEISKKIRPSTQNT